MANLKFTNEALTDLQNKISYDFNDIQNLVLALTHSSYANENKNEKLHSNERLEFLGDAVLNIIISDKLYKDYPKLSEGEMTKARATIVCEQSLVKCAHDIELGKYLLLGKGEENTGGRSRISILSDAFEALIGSIYIDGGFVKARNFVISRLGRLIDDAIKGLISIDYKTQLQEKVQKDGEIKISYEILDEKGPDHNKIFISQVRIGDRIMGKGEGRSKKEAEQSAARAALEGGFPESI